MGTYKPNYIYLYFIYFLRVFMCIYIYIFFFYKPTYDLLRGLRELIGAVLIWGYKYPEPPSGIVGGQVGGEWLRVWQVSA